MRRRSAAGIFIAITVASALFAATRLVSVNGFAAEGALSELVSQKGMARRLLGLELGAAGIGTELVTAFLALPVRADAVTDNEETPQPSPSESFNVPAVDTAPEPTAATPPKDASNELFYQGDEPAPHAGIDNTSPLSPDGIILQNTSGLEIDINRLLSEPLDISLAEDGPQVLIIHTHASEAYTQTPGEEYEESDPYRTQDRSKSIIHVGDVLAEELSARGITVVHDRGTYDYPSYAGAYNRTLEAIRGYLEKYPSISLVIDLHRDARAAGDGDQYKPVAEINGSRCSQIMLVAGTNAAGLEHPKWEQNMKLALRVQHELNRSYPSLARPVGVSEYRYNQHMTTGSLIVEVGAAGNTLSEAVDAVRYFADAYASVVLG